MVGGDARSGETAGRALRGAGNDEDGHGSNGAVLRGELHADERNVASSPATVSYVVASPGGGDCRGQQVGDGLRGGCGMGGRSGEDEQAAGGPPQERARHPASERERETPVTRDSGGTSRQGQGAGAAPLESRLGADVIVLDERHAVVPEDVVNRRQVEIEVRHRERENVVFAAHLALGVA